MPAFPSLIRILAPRSFSDDAPLNEWAPPVLLDIQLFLTLEQLCNVISVTIISTIVISGGRRRPARRRFKDPRLPVQGDTAQTGAHATGPSRSYLFSLFYAWFPVLGRAHTTAFVQETRGGIVFHAGRLLLHLLPHLSSKGHRHP